MIPIFFTRRAERIMLMLILIVAAGLRFAYLGDIRHNIDHAYPIWQAVSTLEHGRLPVVGQPTSVLFANPALTGYLYLPVLALTRSPLAVYVVVIAFNTAAVLLCYRVAKTLSDGQPTPALVAAWLMAVNPWVIEYSRTTWVQSLLPFFTCALAALLFPVLLRRVRTPERKLTAALILMTVFTQTYLLAFLIVAPTALLLLIFRQRVPGRGVAVFVLATGIYAAGLLSQSEAAFARAGNFTAQPARLSGEALSHAARLITGAAADYAGVESGTLVLLIVGVIAAGAAILRRTERRGAAVILIVWWGVPIMAMSYTGSPVHPFYQLLGVPAGYVLAAWGARFLFRGRVGTALLMSGLLVVGAVSALNSLRASEEIARAPGAGHLIALPVGDGAKLGQAISRYLPQDGVVFSSAGEWILNSLAGRTFPVIANTRLPDITIIPYTGGLYVSLTPPDIEPITPQFSELVETLVLRDDVRLDVNRYSPGGVDLSSVAAQLNLSTDEGLTLCCYDLRRNQQDWTLTTYWRVDALQAGSAFGSFAHLYNEAGERIQIVDGYVVPGDVWRVGDVHIHRMQFEVTDTPFTIELGQYDSLSGRNLNFAGGDDTVTLPGKRTRR